MYLFFTWYASLIRFARYLTNAAMHRGACTGASQAGNKPPPPAAPDEEMDDERPPPPPPAAAWEPDRERE